eukprot:SRR837773.11612.p4 GENE.SRR837773.11612~~SRR837773.11612.p4  ORF type:complete len:119 (+),score=1.37 SRR837773.11612:687-1043(+)
MDSFTLGFQWSLPRLCKPLQAKLMFFSLCLGQWSCSRAAWPCRRAQYSVQPVSVLAIRIAQLLRSSLLLVQAAIILRIASCDQESIMLSSSRCMAKFMSARREMCGAQGNLLAPVGSR